MDETDMDDQEYTQEDVEFIDQDDDFEQEPEVKDQKPKITRPIKLKIILAFGIVLSVALSIFLYYSLQLFFSDKQNYIFESGLSHVETIKTTTEEKVEGFSQQVSVFSYLSEKYPEELKKIVNSQKDLMAFYTLSDEMVLMNTFVNQKLKVNQKKLLESPDFPTEFPALSTIEAGDFFIIPAASFTSKPTVLMGIKNPTSKKIFVGLLDFSTTIKMARKNEVFQTDIRSFEAISFANGNKKSSPAFKEVLKKRFNSGTILFGKKDHQEFVSYVKMPSLGMTVIASIPKNKAFSAAYKLIRKTIGYGLILLGFAFAIAVLLSLTITRPLKKLVAQTELVSQGEFDKVELIESSDEIGVLGKSISKMSKQILELLDSKQVMIDELIGAKSELQKYSENLEGLVTARTHELNESNLFIQAMVNSLDEGLFVIDSSGRCSDIYTNSCLEIFENQINGNSFQRLLRYEAGEEEEKTLLKWLDMVYEGRLDFDSLKGLGPKNFSFTDQHDDIKHIEFNYFPMRDDFNDIQNVVVVATDITREVQALKSFEKKESEVEMIIKILASRKNFVNFLETSKYMIADLFLELEKNVIDIDKIKMALHTFKGSFGTYSVLAIHDYCHEFENQIADVEKNFHFRQEWIDFLKPRLDKLENEFLTFCTTASRIVGFDVNKKNTYQRISNDRLEEFASSIRKKGDLKLYSKFRYDFVYSPMSEHFRQYYDLVFELAGRLNKKMHPLKFTNPSIRINEFEYRDFLASLIHIFRNIMDHAIEPPIDRIKLKKEEEGLITIDSRVVERKGMPYFRLSITDDGRGIDPRLVRDRIRQKGLNIPHEDVPDEEIIYAIFSSEFSSKDAVTELSGRGIGLSAVKNEVIKLKGEIEIKTKILKGTSFIFYLPYNIIEQREV